MMKNLEIKTLLAKPLWQMTGEEYVHLHAYACTRNNDVEAAPVTRVTGVRALAEHLSCCESTVYKLRREGVLDAAVLSRVGKNIVFDAEMARRLADEYMNKQRNLKAGE